MSENIKKILDEHEKRIKALEDILKKSKPKKVVKKSTSIAGLIEQCKDEGFFDNPRSLKEIKMELAKNNYHYSVTSLTNPLQRLVRQRVLGRLLQNGKWAYVKR